MYKKVENGQDFLEHEKRARIPVGSNFCCREVRGSDKENESKKIK